MTTTSPGFGTPYREAPLVEGEGTDVRGRPVKVRIKPTDTWWQFFVNLSQQSARSPVAVISPSASPYTYTAAQIGSLVVRGGTVSLLQLVRGGSAVNVTGAVVVPLCADDSVVVTYSVMPTVTFVPGART